MWLRGTTSTSIVELHKHEERRSTLRDRATHYLGQLNLQDKASSQIEWLSGGEAQRVGIVRALINNPKLLFLRMVDPALLDPDGEASDAIELTASPINAINVRGNAGSGRVELQDAAVGPDYRHGPGQRFGERPGEGRPASRRHRARLR